MNLNHLTRQEDSLHECVVCHAVGLRTEPVIHIALGCIRSMQTVIFGYCQRHKNGAIEAAAEHGIFCHCGNAPEWHTFSDYIISETAVQ